MHPIVCRPAPKMICPWLLDTGAGLDKRVIEFQGWRSYQDVGIDFLLAIDRAETLNGREGENAIPMFDICLGTCAVPRLGATSALVRREGRNELNSRSQYENGT